MRKTLQERFNLAYKEDSLTGCWLWAKGKSPKGYGRITVAGKPQQAHRVALSLAGVQVPADMMALHKCDVRECVNPAHLYVGTNQDNMNDMKVRDRHVSANGKKTHCKLGHKFSNANTRVDLNGYPAGRRVCIACVSRRNARRPSRV